MHTLLHRSRPWPPSLSAVQHTSTLTLSDTFTHRSLTTIRSHRHLLCSTERVPTSSHISSTISSLTANTQLSTPPMRTFIHYHSIKQVNSLPRPTVHFSPARTAPIPLSLLLQRTHHCFIVCRNCDQSPVFDPSHIWRNSTLNFGFLREFSYKMSLSFQICHRYIRLDTTL